jgi:BirA family biotin operon repressor/biotin-[acetyl-CoA-carboxylase] ligase
MSPVVPRPLLDVSMIAELVSQYWRVSVVEVTGSTQLDLLEKAKLSAVQDGEVLLTEYQESGKGRLDRTFEAAPSTALMFSLYIEPAIEKSEWSFIPLLAGLSVALSVNEINPSINVTLKWPNDLLIGEKKLGGIIAQATENGVVLGIGINVEMDVNQLPVAHATSLLLEAADNLNRNSICAAILNTFRDLLERWIAGEDLLHLYYERSATLGREVAIQLPGNKSVSGLASSFSRSGELILEDGTRVTVGDVIHLR